MVYKLWSRIKAIWYYFGRNDMRLQQFSIGMNSTVGFDSHILFLDYDDVSLQQVEESVIECQKFWNLSDAFIYKTHGGYHSIFYFDQLPYSRVKLILDYARFVDDMFRFISRFYDYKTIRVSGKYKLQDIEFVKIVKGQRSPTLREAELGDLKRKEREYLKGMHGMLRQDALRGDDEQGFE